MAFKKTLIYYLSVWITFLYKLPQFSSLKQHKCITSQFYRSEFQWTWLVSMPQVSWGVKRLGFYQEALRKSASLHIQIVGRIQFHLAVGLRSPFPGWWWVRGHPKPLEAAQILWSSIFKVSNSGSSLLTLEICSLSPHLSSASLFPASFRFFCLSLPWLHWDNLNHPGQSYYFKVNQLVISNHKSTFKFLLEHLDSSLNTQRTGILEVHL